MSSVTNKSQRALTQLKEALAGVRGELQRARSGIEAIDSASQLELIAKSLERMINAVESGSLPGRSERSVGLWRAVIDTWPYNSELRDKVVEAELLFDRL